MAVVALALLMVAAPVGLHAETPSIRRVVAAGQSAPGGGLFEHFTVESQPVVAPVNRRGQVAFFATLLRGPASEGVFLATDGRITRVAVEGDPAPGGGSLSGFGRHPVPAINSTGAVAFVAAVAGGRTVEGVFMAIGRRLRPIAVAGGPAPGIPAGTLASLDAPALNDRGDVAFLATARRGRETVEAVYLWASGRLRKVVAQGDPAPAGGMFAGFGPPAVNNAGLVVFGAVVEGRGVPGGIFRASGERVRMVAGAGDPSPAGGIFFKFSERVTVSDVGAIAFNALLKDAPTGAGVFLAQAERVRTVVTLGDRVAQSGTVAYLGLWPAVTATGAVAFAASLEQGSAPIAICLAGETGVARLAGIGDALPGGGTLASFGLYPAVAASPTGHVTFAAAPTATGEGAEGIYLAEPPHNR
jgi:hypothetical protein